MDDQSKIESVKKIEEILVRYQKIIFFFAGTGIIIAYFWRLFFPKPQFYATPEYGYSGLIHVFLPIQKIYTASLKNNFFLIKNQNLMENFGYYNIQNFLIYYIFSFPMAVNVSVLATFLRFFVGYFFLFIEFRIKSIIAFFCALILTFSGFNIVHLIHPSLILTASYFPLIFIFLERFCKFKRLIDFVIYLFLEIEMFMANYSQFFILINFFFFLYAFTLGQKKIGSFIFIFTVIVVLFSRFFGIEWGKPLPTNILGDFSYPPQHAISFFSPYFFGNPKYGNYPVYTENWSLFWESTFYVGIIPAICFLSMGVAFFFGSSKENFVRKTIFQHKIKVVFLLSILFFLLGCGKFTPFYLVSQLPILNTKFCLSRYLFIFAFGIILVFAKIMNFFYLLALQKKREKLLFTVCFCCLLTFTEVIIMFWNYHLIIPQEEILKKPPILKSLPQNTNFVSLNSAENWNFIFIKKGWGATTIKDYLFLSNQLNNYLPELFEKQKYIINDNYSFIKTKKGELVLNKETVRQLKKNKINFIITNKQLSDKFLRQVIVLKRNKLKIIGYQVFF